MTTTTPQITVARAAVGFLLANLVLTAIAVAADWRGTLDMPADAGSAADTFASYGTAISGPILPVVVTGAVGLLAHRRDRLGVAATAVIGVMGALITINGVRGALADAAAGTPQAVQTAGGVLFAAFGLLLATAAVRALRR